MKKAVLPFLLSGTLLAAAPTDRAPLKVGDAIPHVNLRTGETQVVNLQKLVSEKPTALFVYRCGS